MAQIELYGGKVIVDFAATQHRYKITIPGNNIIKTRFSSVTTVLGKLDKSGPLMWWATNQFALYVNLELDEIVKQIRKNARNNEVQVTEEWVRSVLERGKIHWKTAKQIAANIGTAVHEYMHAHFKFMQAKGPQPIEETYIKELNREEREKFRTAKKAMLAWIQKNNVVIVETERIVFSPTLGVVGTLDIVLKIGGKLCIADMKSGKGLYSEVWMQLATYKKAYEEETGKVIDAVWALHLDKETGECTDVRRGNEHHDSDLASFEGLLTTHRWKEREDGEENAPSKIKLK